MQRGWEFRFADRVYFVGARDVETARYLVLQHLRSEGDVRPEEMPESAVRFLKLAEGTLIEARVFDFNEMLNDNRTYRPEAPSRRGRPRTGNDSEEGFDRILKKVARSNPREAADRRAVEEAKAARARKIANAPPKNGRRKQVAK